MDLFQREKQLREQFEDTQVQFMLTELDTATTFCNVANSSNNLEKVERNIANACEAYNTVLKHLPEVRFDSRSKGEFDVRMAHLQTLLRALGQHI